MSAPGRSMPPRVVVVTRPSELDLLVARHATKEQARFFLAQRDQRLEPLEQAHRALESATGTVLAAVPLAFRRARIGRDDLPRFLFEPGDVVVAVGQDGLIANVAKYLEGQPVIGVTPASQPTVLMRHVAEGFADALADVVANRCALEERTMVQARLDDGQTLRSLNEVFVGHRSHQSARYRVAAPDHPRPEAHSSSGLVVSSGTGATGWAASIARAMGIDALPAPTEARLAYFVREAWPSPSTGTTVVHGWVTGPDALRVRSEMNDGGVVFGDGIETDRLPFGWGQEVAIGVSPVRLRLAT